MPDARDSPESIQQTSDAADRALAPGRQEGHLKTWALQNAIFNSANFSSIATDAQGVIQIFNVGAERMLGYAAAEVLNRITPADISDPNEVIARAAALSLQYSTLIAPGFEALVFKASRGIEDIYELTYIHKNGSRLPAVVSVTALRDAQEGVIGYLLIGTDNTARKQAETALIQAGALQNAIFNSAMFSKIATDANGVIQIFNVGAENMLGYAAAEVMNKITPADISDPHELVARAKALSCELGTPITPGFEALAFKASRGIEDIYELTYVRKDGSRFPAVVSVTALRDARQAIIGYLLIGTDNTARKRADAEKLEHDALLHTIHLHSIVSVTDRAGCIVEVNDGFCRISGYSREELLGQTHRIVNSGTQSAAFWTDMWPSITAGRPWRGEICNRTKGGSLYWVDSIIAPFLDERGETKKYISISTDVTARKQAEGARQAMNAELSRAKLLAEKANLAKSDFLSNMSHELRSPLNAILGFAQLIDSGAPPPTPSQKESVDQILQAGWYLLELINEILDLSLIESGKISLSPEAMSLAEVLADCHAMIEPQAQKCGIRLRFPSFDGPCFVKADRTRVKQVLINLLSNAIKYNRVGGTVEVSCRLLTAERIRVSCRDTGAGLSEEKLAQLFQPFNRLGQESGAEEGTGIGLVVSKRLVELMGGQIGAESVVGVGSVFWVELNSTTPLELPTDAVDSKSAPLFDTAPGAAVHTLLCVEDNPANLMLVERLVARRPDIRLLTARDGNRGIELARSARPDAILMDINLPGISGLIALRILAEDRATAAIPVIALSANAMPHDIQKGMEAGFFRYLTKPIKVDEFMEAIDLALTFSKTRSNDATVEVLA